MRFVEPLESRRLLAIPLTYPTGPGPATVSLGRDGKLAYTYEPNGDRIPDFSNCGYRGGGVPIPTVGVKATLTPIAGDNLPQIQAALNNLAAQPLDAGGFRGTILLKAGVYPISGTIRITTSGIVLRGEGSGTTGTILRQTAGNVEIITITGSGSRAAVANTTHNVTNAYVPVGATWVTLDSVANLNVGDTIQIKRPQTQAWVDYIGQTDHFQSGDATLSWDRTITEIDGNRIRFDAPITEALDAQWGGGTVNRYTWSGRITNCGVEDLRADCTTGVDSIGNTDGIFMTISGTMNCWVRRCYTDKMRGHPIWASSSKWDTFEDIVSYHVPVASHSGSSVQMFAGSFSELCLWHRLTANSGGFEFSGGRQNPGPMAWVESQVPQGFAFSGPHEQWNMGYLWDSLNMAHNLAVIEQGKGHAGANHVAWNNESTGVYNFENLPTTHQWIIGSIGDPLPTVKANLPPDRVISYGTHLEPGSLYRSQLYERVGQQAGLSALGKPDGSNWFDLTSTGSASATVKAGQTATAQVTLTTALKYTGQPISFSFSGLPTGATLVSPQPPYTADGQSVFNILTRSTTPAGTYKVKLIGTGTFPLFPGGTQAVRRSTFVTLTVTPTTTAGVTRLYQAEDVAVAATSNGDGYRTLGESGLSGGKAIQLDSNAVGDFIRFRLPDVPAGAYDVRIGVKKWQPRAIVQVQADGVADAALPNVGAPIDLYSSSTAYAEMDLGNWTASTGGDKFFQFNVTGKNPASSGYTIVIDYVRLIPT